MPILHELPKVHSRLHFSQTTPLLPFIPQHAGASDGRLEAARPLPVGRAKYTISDRGTRAAQQRGPRGSRVHKMRVHGPLTTLPGSYLGFSDSSPRLVARATATICV